MRRTRLAVVVAALMLLMMMLSATALVAQPAPNKNSEEGRAQAASQIQENPMAAENIGENNPAIGEDVHPTTYYCEKVIVDGDIESGEFVSGVPESEVPTYEEAGYTCTIE